VPRATLYFDPLSSLPWPLGHVRLITDELPSFKLLCFPFYFFETGPEGPELED